MTENLPEPASRKEQYLAKAAGMDVDELPEPASREEEYLNAIAENGGGGGGETKPIKVLTSADYNYPKTAPDSISLGLLESGFYKVDSNDTYVFCPTKRKNVKDVLYYVCEESSNGAVWVYVFDPNNGPEYRNYCVMIYAYNPSNGAILTQSTKGLLDKAYIVNNLTTDEADRVLSAKQGKVLKDYIDGLVGDVEDDLEEINNGTGA